MGGVSVTISSHPVGSLVRLVARPLQLHLREDTHAQRKLGTAASNQTTQLLSFHYLLDLRLRLLHRRVQLRQPHPQRVRPLLNAARPRRPRRARLASLRNGSSPFALVLHLPRLQLPQRLRLDKKVVLRLLQPLLRGSRGGPEEVQRGSRGDLSIKLRRP
eukprot:106284-Prorocentrum_minimum.AAC.2